MQKAITHLKLNDANQTKLAKLDALANEYLRVVQLYIDFIFDNQLTSVGKYDPIPDFETALSERWKRCAWQQATSIMRSFFTNERTHKPVLSAVAIQANPNVVVIEPSETDTFDYWLRISTLESGKPIRVPVTLHKYAKKLLSQGQLRPSVRLNKQDGIWYASFIVKTSDQKPEPDGSLVGVDIGIKNTLTTSKGNHFGQFSDELKRRVEQAIFKRRRKQKLNQCLEKKGLPTVSLSDKKTARFIRNEIGRTINALVKTLPQNTTVVLENLSIKTMRFKSRRMNRLLSASQIGYLSHHLRYRLDASHIRYRSVVAAYSSQECAACGYVDERNRPTQERFCCLMCGHTDNADVNSGKVLVKRFDDTELSKVGDYCKVKAMLLERFFDRFPAARSVAGGLDTEPVTVVKTINGQSAHLMPVSQTRNGCL